MPAGFFVCLVFAVIYLFMYVLGQSLTVDLWLAWNSADHTGLKLSLSAGIGGMR